jgi:transposase
LIEWSGSSSISPSKKSLHPTKKGTEEVQSARFDYWQLLKGLLLENLIFLDESGVNPSFIRKCARAVQGNRADGERPCRKGKNVSVIGAISLKGLVTQWSTIGSVDGLTFEAFIAQKLVPNLWKGAIVIMDNCSIHKGDEIEALITAAGASLIYLPPYSPDFSPIENYWSKIKSSLRRIGARTYAELLKALDEAFAEVTSKDLLG